MLGPLLNTSSIANARSQLFLNKSPYNHTNLPSKNDDRQISYFNSNLQTESKHRSSVSSLSLISADHYADIEWPVKKALTFGYANYASREELIKYLTTTQSSDINLGANNLKNSQNNIFETNGQIATYYFKLFPSFYSTAKTNVSSYYFNDKKKNKNKKKQILNTRKSYKERIGAEKSSKNSKKLNYFNINEDHYFKSSSSSSSSSRRSSTDNEINANVNKSKKNTDNNINEIKLNKLTEVKKLKKKKLINKKNDLLIDDNDISLMSSSESLYKQILEEIQDENLVAEEENLDEDEDDELNVFNDLNDLENNSTNSNQQNKNVLYELIDRDKNDKQLLNTLMQNSAHFKDLSQRLPENYFNISEFSHSSKISNSPSNLTVSSLLPETPSHNLFNSNNTSSHKKILEKNNSDVDNQLSFLENQSFNNHFNHYYDLIEDSEEDDDTDQFVTTISLSKKNRNVRHSKPFADANSASLKENSLIKKDEDDFVIFESDNNSLKKRRELKSETLPKPAALQSSSSVNHWINSTSLPLINTEKLSSTPTTFINNISSSLISSNFSSLNNTKNKTVDRPTLNSARSWKTILFLTLMIIAICTVILLAIFGNLLVIISVLRHHKLRITTNYFVVSLACADILVALFAMTFKASLAIQGSWMFGQLVCDLWNSCDVLFSTASIMHLCCISVDRYYAIIKPLDYPMKITNKFVFIMLTVVWISSTLISFIPIFTGIYTTKEFLEYQKTHPDECEFHVNPYYALISSTVSFWLPCMVMLFTYYRIYLEATRQEKLLYESQMIPRHQHRGKKNNQKKQTKSSNVPSKPKQLTSTHNNNANNLNNNRNSNNNNYNQVNLNQNDKNNEILTSKTNLPETTTIGHNGARLSNTSTTTTATTISTSTTTTASKSSNGVTQQATTHVTQAETNNRNIEDINNQRKISSVSVTNSINDLPNSQSIELNNSQINLSTRDPAIQNPQPPQNISIQSANSEQNIGKNTHRNSHGDDTESGQSTPTKRNINRMRREHKAAKTLGIIMGAFFICWLPFFTAYVVLSVCGSNCDFFPTVVVDFLFWIGYFNSSLNPIIYAYFNREFREAFKETIQNVFCCCLYKVECMRNIRYQLARQNPDRVKNNMNAINYARRNTTASYTGQFNNMLGPTSGGCTNNSLLNNSNTNINNKNSCQNKLDVTKT